MKHKRIILVGPSAAGKNFIRENFVSKGFKGDVSYTSRTPREGEIEGKEYHFITVEEFREMIVEELFYEWIKYGDNYYGTGRYEWEHADVFIMEADGVSKIYPKDRPDTLVIYVNTRFDVRLYRMRQRGWDSEKINERTKIDMEKFKNFEDYDVQISSEII